MNVARKLAEKNLTIQTVQNEHLNVPNGPKMVEIDQNPRRNWVKTYQKNKTPTKHQSLLHTQTREHELTRHDMHIKGPSRLNVSQMCVSPHTSNISILKEGMQEEESWTHQHHWARWVVITTHTVCAGINARQDKFMTRGAFRTLRVYTSNAVVCVVSLLPACCLSTATSFVASPSGSSVAASLAP